MKRVLFDSNVVLDVLLARQPHVVASKASWAGIEQGKAEGIISAHAITTIHYILRREIGNNKATAIIASILKVFGVAAVNNAVLQDALQSELFDFEDAVTASAAKFAACELIVTRDPKGFRNSPVRSVTPEALLPILEF